MEELLEQGTEGYVLREFLRLGKELLIQQLLEGEVEDSRAGATTSWFHGMKNLHGKVPQEV